MAAYAKDGNPGLTVPTLMLVTDRRLTGGADGLVRAVEAAVAGGVNAVQMREKDLAPQEMAALARRLGEAIAGRAALIVNGPPEVAAEAGAHGVHLPETAPLSRPVGALFFGRSAHSLESALKAEREGADYVVAGPVYETVSHPGAAPAGITLIRKIAVEVKLPVIAIGGVTLERVREVLCAGASGVAAIRAILESESPRQAAQRLARELEAACLELGALRR